MFSFDKVMTQATKVVIAIFMSLMIIFVFFEVIFRYFIGMSPFFIEEVSRGLLIWVSFLGASVALRAAQHIGVEVFVEMLPIHIRKKVRWTAKISVLSFLLFFLFASTKYSIHQLGQQSATLPISMFWFYLALPCGSFLMILQLIFSMREGGK